MCDRRHACFAKKAEERLNSELFRNGSVYEFYRLEAITLEQVNTSVVEKKKKKNLNWQNFDLECCKLAFHANDPSEEHAVYFRR